MYEVYTFFFGHDSFIELCGKFRCMRGTPEYLNQISERMRPERTSTTDHQSDFQNATFHFVVLNECAVPRETQLPVHSTSDLLLRISDPGTKFKTRLVSEIPTNNLAWIG